MLGLPFKKGTTGQALRAWSGRCRLKLFYLFGGFIVVGDDSEDLAVVLTDVTLFGACERYRVFDHCIKHRLKLGRRACNDTQNLTCRRLLLQRLGKIAVAVLQFLK